MNQISESHHLQTDSFDRIPDSLVLLIFNSVSDTKTLIRCRIVSKRFNSLVPQSENLLVKVDSVVSTDTHEWFMLYLLKSILHFLKDLVLPKRIRIPTGNSNSSAEILRGFERIKRLEIELPAGDLRLGKGAVVKWKARFGKTLKSCVILAVRTIGKTTDAGDREEDEIDIYGDRGGGLKLRVVWTISTLIAASARHYLLGEIIKEHREIEGLVLKDREGEGTVVMDKEGLREFFEDAHDRTGTVGWKTRTTVPEVRLTMRHEPWLDLPGGVRLKGATLVVVGPTNTGIEEENQDVAFDLPEFEGVYKDAATALLKSRRLILEMNSF